MLMTLINWLLGDDEANRQRDARIAQEKRDIVAGRHRRALERQAEGIREVHAWHAKEVAKVRKRIRACPKCHGTIEGGGFWCCRPYYGDIEYLDRRRDSMLAPH